MTELADRIKGVIDEEPVVLFMKGTPQFAMCGNSSRALEALRAQGAPVTAVDIMRDPSIRQELQELSGWPTIPQVFVKGELVGGADITQELAESGELKQLLEDEARRGVTPTAPRSASSTFSAALTPRRRGSSRRAARSTL